MKTIDAYRSALLPFIVNALLLTLSVSGQEAKSNSGLIRSQFSMTAARSVTVGFFPALHATDMSHSNLLTSTDRKARVHVGELQVPPMFQSGEFRVDSHGEQESRPVSNAGPFEDAITSAPQTFELHLARYGTNWTLEANRPSDEQSVPHEIVWEIPVTTTVVSNASPTFSAAVVPTANTEGYLSLSWGKLQWTSNFSFTEPIIYNWGKVESEDSSTRAAAVVPPVFRYRDDNEASHIGRTYTLGNRNESSIILPDPASSRISVHYWKDLHIDHPDFATIAALKEDKLVTFSEAAVLRLRTMQPLRFGNITIDTENLTPGFVGLYGLWIKRVEAGWRLVFNNEPDVWGTQHNPYFDAAEIDLTYSTHSGSTRPFGAFLVPTSNRSGRLIIRWGQHEWSADFTVAS